MLTSCYRRRLLKPKNLSTLTPALWPCKNVLYSPFAQQRNFTKTCPRMSLAESILSEYKESLDARQKKQFNSGLHRKIGKEIVFSGFLRNKKQLNAGLVFATLSRGSPSNTGIQVTLKQESEDLQPEEVHLRETFKKIKEHSAVSVTGILQYKAKRPFAGAALESERRKLNLNTPIPWEDLEVLVKDVKVLNSFPDDIVVGSAQKFGLESRHLQIRFDSDLHARLQFRSNLARLVREKLHDFTEIETPILFKSSPEGAREFLVPTRRPGYAYALPQSPQQYKQILMASGVSKYFQFAKCFRDEDLRADRQPEFTQIDMEMAWAEGQDVMRRVAELVNAVHSQLDNRRLRTFSRHIPHMTYNKAMSRYGVDKPDPRSLDLIYRIDHIIPPNLKAMLTSIPDPIIEVCKFRLDGNTKTIQKFIRNFMDSADAQPFHQNPDGPPGVFVVDPSKPLENLHAFGFDGVEALKSFYTSFPPNTPVSRKLQAVQSQVSHEPEALDSQESHEPEAPESQVSHEPEAPESQETSSKSTPVKRLPTPKPADVTMLGEISGVSTQHNHYATNVIDINGPRIATPLGEGDLLILQARPNAEYSGGSTMLGKLRSAIFKRAVSEKLITPSPGLHYMWVTDFPLFTANTANPSDPGQGGTAGFSSTHHPFTAPKKAADVDLLLTEPLSAKADHYDLVCNGVEIGGGSKRIHKSEMQKFIMRDVLKMSEERMKDFDHLFEALRAGCPPHAGFAMGFDRWVALLTGVESVRDVIYFPKGKRGEDLMVGSPAKVTDLQRRIYGLKEDKGEKKEDQGEQKEDQVVKEEQEEKKEDQGEEKEDQAEKKEDQEEQKE